MATECLGSDLSNDEIEAALAAAPKGHSPGPDELPVEFYSTFWPVIGPTFTTCLITSLNELNLPAAFLNGVVTLIPKRAHPTEFDHYRPITLLNSDYKLLGRALADRLRPHLPTVISESQVANVQKRRLHDAILYLKFVVEKFREVSPGTVALISLDQDKAFDRVQWNFLWAVMERMGIGSRFLSWIKLMYTGATSAIKLGGAMSRSCRLHRGVRQGCPLSATLYIISVEPLLRKLHSVPLQQTVHVPNSDEPFRGIAYADDITIIATSKNDLTCYDRILRQFADLTGSTLNRAKTRGIHTADWVMEDLRALDIDWTQRQMKVLGFTISLRPPSVVYPWDEWTTATEKKLARWRTRMLPMRTRACILRTHVVPRITFGAVVHRPSKAFLTSLRVKLFHFVWNKPSRFEPIKRTTLELPPEEGGMGVPHLVTAIDVATFGLMARALWPDSQVIWRPFAIYYLGFSMRGDIPDWASPRFTHYGGGTPPPWIALITGIRDKIVTNIDSDANWYETPSARLYSALLPKSPPRIQTVQPHRRWPHIWQRMSKLLRLPFGGDLAWLLANDTVMNNVKLTAWHLTFSSKCRACGMKETTTHLYVECPRVQSLWNELSSLFGVKTLATDTILWLDPLPMSPPNSAFCLAVSTLRSIVYTEWRHHLNTPTLPLEKSWGRFRDRCRMQLCHQWTTLDRRAFHNHYCSPPVIAESNQEMWTYLVENLHHPRRWQPP